MTERPVDSGRIHVMEWVTVYGSELEVHAQS